MVLDSASYLLSPHSSCIFLILTSAVSALQLAWPTLASPADFCLTACCPWQPLSDLSDSLNNELMVFVFCFCLFITVGPYLWIQYWFAVSSTWPTPQAWSSYPGHGRIRFLRPEFLWIPWEVNTKAERVSSHLSCLQALSISTKDSYIRLDSISHTMLAPAWSGLANKYHRRRRKKHDKDRYIWHRKCLRSLS